MTARGPSGEPDGLIESEAEGAEATASGVSSLSGSAPARPSNNGRGARAGAGSEPRARGGEGAPHPSEDLEDLPF